MNRKYDKPEVQSKNKRRHLSGNYCSMDGREKEVENELSFRRSMKNYEQNDNEGLYQRNYVNLKIKRRSATRLIYDHTKKRMRKI